MAPSSPENSLRWVQLVGPYTGAIQILGQIVGLRKTYPGNHFAQAIQASMREQASWC